MKKILLGLAVVSFSTAISAAELVPECQSYFKEADSLLDASLASAKAQGMDPKAVKAQYEASKTQFAALPADQQKATCEQALKAIEQTKKAQEQAQEQAKAAQK